MMGEPFNDAVCCLATTDHQFCNVMTFHKLGIDEQWGL